MKIEVTGINLAPNPKWDRPLVIAAFCDVRLDGWSTTLFGVALAWSRAGWFALPPKAAGSRANDPGVIKWAADGPVPQAICKAMLARYQAFGGPTPPAPTESQERANNAARRIAEKRAAESDPFADYDVVEAGGLTFIGLPKPEDDSGVLRTLKVEQEICDRAGL